MPIEIRVVLLSAYSRSTKTFHSLFYFQSIFIKTCTTNQAEQMIPDKEQISNFHIVNGRKQLEVFENGRTLSLQCHRDTSNDAKYL